MKIVFLGTPDFAVLPLKYLVDAGHEIVAVVTQPDKPVGRKQILTPCAVKQTAIELGLKVLQFDKIRRDGVEDLKALSPDLMVTCAYGQILSQEVLDIPKYGTLNIHASLLPELRGSSPIQWSLIRGHKETGITIMLTDIGVDTGDILLQEKISIIPNENAGELFDRLSILGAEAIVKAIDLFKKGQIVPIKQDHSKATYTKMLSKEMAKIDFSLTAQQVHDFVRGLNPWPVAYFTFGGEVIKVFKTEVLLDYTLVCGTVIDANPKNGLIIACQTGAIKVLEVQRAGGKRLAIADFLRGFNITEGSVLND